MGVNMCIHVEIIYYFHVFGYHLIMNLLGQGIHLDGCTSILCNKENPPETTVMIANSWTINQKEIYISK